MSSMRGKVFLNTNIPLYHRGLLYRSAGKKLAARAVFFPLPASRFFWVY